MLEAIFGVFIAPVMLGLLLFGVLGGFGATFSRVGKKIYNTSDESNTNENGENSENSQSNNILIKILYWVCGFVILVFIVGAMISVGFPAILIAFFIILRLFS